MRAGPLDGVVVLDATQALAGPFSAMVLGDIGADVLKIEHPQGDGVRAWGPPFMHDSGPTFVGYSRNKRSVAIDLHTEEGRSHFLQLVAHADVVVENFRPGTMARFGVGYEQCRAVKPDIIFCSISGYGQTGPMAHRAAMDLMIQAVSGMMDLTGEPEGRPVKAAAPISDLMGGFCASFSILAALHARSKDGQGRQIDVSMLDAMITMLGQAITAYTIGGTPPERQGNAHPLMAPYEAFRTSTREFVISLTTQKRWDQLCSLPPFAHMVGREEFLTQKQRNANRVALCAEIQAIFLTRTADEWMEDFIRLGLPAAPVNSVPEILEEPQVIQRGSLLEVEYPEGSGNRVKVPGMPWRDVAPDRPVRSPPMIGQHTEEVFRQFGIK